MRRVLAVGVAALGLLAAGCGSTVSGDHEVSTGPRPVSDDGAPAPPGRVIESSRLGVTPLAANGPGLLSRLEAGAQPVLPSREAMGPVLGEKAPPPANVYQATIAPTLSPAVRDIPTRVYVPNSDAHTVSVIDPATLEVVDKFSVGHVPHHVTPSWDLSKLYVNNTEGNTLTVIDPRTGKVTETKAMTDPYNLYFTPDGKKAIVVAERLKRLDYRDPNSWELIKSVSVPWAGVDHLDFSADGRYLLASCEFSGQVVKVDTETMEVVGRVNVGSMPIDVKMSPDGTVLYVANQGRHGVSLVDPETMTEIGFLRTGTGAHGLNVSRDAATLFVSNRMEGTISVIDFATRSVRQTWRVGGSPDMIQVSADGAQLWVSNRFHGSVSVIDTTNGRVIATIPTGAGAHGVSLFPQPGRYNVGHNGVYR